MTKLYGLGLSQGIQLATAADLPSKLPRRADAPVRSIGALVELLEGQLLRRETLRREAEGTPAWSELTRQIDELVHEITRRSRVAAGDHIAGTTLIRTIGSGNFATIWLSKEDGSATLRATKVFTLERLSEGIMLWRFRRSIRAMQVLNEGNIDHIVKLHDVDEGTLAFSMEFLSEGNLESAPRRGWTLEKKIEVILDVCRAVQRAHETGIIHRSRRRIIDETLEFMTSS